MQYIYRDDGLIQFDRYKAYLDSIREKLPANTREFVFKELYAFSEKEILHDAWLESLAIRERPATKAEERRSLEIELWLLGAFEDQRNSLFIKVCAATA